MKTWTGVEPAVGGRHPGVGTHNALLSLGQGSYLEVIAPDPSQDRFSGLGALLEHLANPALITWCVSTTNLEALATSARSAGLTQGEPIAMSRRRPDGVQLRWRILLVENHPFGPIVPFFIQWDTPHHPSQSTPVGCRLKSFELRHPEPDALVACLHQLDVQTEVVEAAEPGLAATLATPRGDLALPPVLASG